MAIFFNTMTKTIRESGCGSLVFHVDPTALEHHLSFMI
jgi:hypothetical protein